MWKLFLAPKFIKKYRWLFVIVLLLLIGLFSLSNNLYQHDIATLVEFSVAYDAFDAAITDFSLTHSSSSETHAREALRGLAGRAHFRTSSLIKHDAEIMDQALLISDLSEQELVSLVSYTKALRQKRADTDPLSFAYRNLDGRRKSAYTHFQELGGVQSQ